MFGGLIRTESHPERMLTSRVITVSAAWYLVSLAKTQNLMLFYFVLLHYGAFLFSDNFHSNFIVWIIENKT